MQQNKDLASAFLGEKEINKIITNLTDHDENNEWGHKGMYMVCACSVVSDSFQPVDYSPASLLCHWILQASILGGLPFPSGASSQPRIKFVSVCLLPLDSQILCAEPSGRHISPEKRGWQQIRGTLKAEEIACAKANIDPKRWPFK